MSAAGDSERLIEAWNNVCPLGEGALIRAGDALAAALRETEQRRRRPARVDSRDGFYRVFVGDRQVQMYGGGEYDRARDFADGWNAALREGAAPRTHGRGCGCTPCRAEDWDAVDARIRADHEGAGR